LEKLVAERTKEVMDRSAELERWYQLTVGREVRMAELKKKIQNLEDEVKAKK
jgi:hypothetical protein